MKRIILGSNSPRRRELLAGLDIDFTVDTGNTFEEQLEPGVEAHEVPLHLSAGKSHGFHRPLERDEVLITSDTVVIVDGEVLGKPHSREEAVEMLRRLSGRAHEVVTAVTLRDCAKEETFSDSTQVHFEPLTPEQIDYYVDRYRPFDKAGAYGIQEWIGYVGISSIEGSFYNVMGFPVHRVWKELQQFL
ncbi:MAG: septum formation protein Maf [Bacteroidales bacterium]|nr:septum formation protein Maf [Bacteroidales bacterium]